MKIAFGRRLLLLSFITEPPRERFPSAIQASDSELARLNSRQEAMLDRTRWESNALLYGSVRLKA